MYSFLKRIGALSALFFQFSASATLIGLEWSGSLWSLDQQQSGVSAQEIGQIGPTGFNSMAVGSDGTIYTILTRNLPIDDAALFSIDPLTGSATLLHQFTMPPEPSPFTSARINALAFNEANGLLYFVDVIVSDGSNTPRISDLYTLDPSDGTYTFIGSMEIGAATTMAFDDNGNLYAWIIDSTDLGPDAGLSIVDIATGVATDLDPNFGGGPDLIQAMAFDANGRLFGGNEYLFEIDIATGELFNPELIFENADIRGLEFIGVPLPAGIVLFLSAILSVLLPKREFFNFPRWRWNGA